MFTIIMSTSSRKSILVFDLLVHLCHWYCLTSTETGRSPFHTESLQHLPGQSNSVLFHQVQHLQCRILQLQSAQGSQRRQEMCCWSHLREMTLYMNLQQIHSVSAPFSPCIQKLHCWSHTGQNQQ